jgi:hypothetical protein
MLTLRREQMQRLSEAMLKRFEDRMVAHLHAAFPKKLGETPEAELRTLIQSGLAKSAVYKVESEADVERYLEFMVELGPDFDSDPRLGWAGQILRRQDLWPWEKLDKIETQLALTLKRHENPYGA